jgi:type II secretory pathway pseudopilin PulG
MTSRRGGRGYTLLELLVVMGIIMILMGMVASGLSGMVRSRRVKNSVSAVLNVIHMARSRAISDNAITHVRVENSATEQRISIYRFPKASDAIRATTNTVVAMLGPDAAHRGWNVLSDQNNGYCNYRMEGQKLEPNCWFVTNYVKSSMWDSTPTRNRILHGAPSDGDVPREGETDTDGTLLSFNPDGTAAANLLFYIRDDSNLMWVRVYKGGEVKSGDVKSWNDLEQVN